MRWQQKMIIHQDRKLKAIYLENRSVQNKWKTNRQREKSMSATELKEISWIKQYLYMKLALTSKHKK